MAKKKLQKLFAVLLALSMLMSMVSVTAMADEDDDGEAEEKTVITGVEVDPPTIEVPYGTSKDAVLVQLSDITVTGTVAEAEEEPAPEMAALMVSEVPETEAPAAEPEAPETPEAPEEPETDPEAPATEPEESETEEPKDEVTEAPETKVDETEEPEDEETESKAPTESEESKDEETEDSETKAPEDTAPSEELTTIEAASLQNDPASDDEPEDKTVEISVTWDCEDYDQWTAGDYTFTGTPTDSQYVFEEVSVTVTVAEQSNVVAQINEKTYETLDMAVADAADGDTIELLANCTTDAGLNLSKDLTIQAAEDAGRPTIKFIDKGFALWGKALTFKDVNIEMKGVGKTPYVEWSWMAVCASKNASLTLDNVTMTMDGTGAGNAHTIYFCSNNKLNLINGTVLTIQNYKQDALEWDGGDGGYNVNIKDSTFISDHNRSGFTGTFYATIDNSTVKVINSTGNGSNGSHFIIKNSDVNFSNNGSHGLSTGILDVTDSTITAKDNGMTGIIFNNKATFKNADITITGTKGTSYWNAGMRCLGSNASATIDEDTKLTITDNKVTGLFLDANTSVTIEEGAQVLITRNHAEQENCSTKKNLAQCGGGIVVRTGAIATLSASTEIYNNHALLAGDDIYLEGEGSSITFAKTGSDWYLDGAPDCEGAIDAIDGWYEDGYAYDEDTTGTRWKAHGSKPYHVESIPDAAFDEETGLVEFEGGVAFKAAHGLQPLEPGELGTADWEISKSKTATELKKQSDGTYTSDVTLSLPSASYKGDLDVAFVLDGSTSADQAGLAAQAAALLDELAEIENLNVKVSLTVFGGRQPILYRTDLLDISNEGNRATLKYNLTDPSFDGMKDEVGSLRSGSNLMAGVEEASAILAADTQVSDADKYMVILSDGAARMWVNEDGDAMSQTYIPEKTIFWNSNEDFLKRYENKEIRPFAEVWEAGQSGALIDNYGMTEAQKDSASPEAVASWYIVENDPDYYTTYEAATYYAATSIAEASQNAHVIMVTYPYHDEKNYGQYIESFKAWLAENYVTRYESRTMSEENVFDAVKDELIQLVDAGSTVVDVIGYGKDNEGNDYNFDFVNDINALTLTVAGEKLSVTELEPDLFFTHPNATAGYGFSKNEEDGYSFLLYYYENGQDGKSDECFVWEINTAVTKDEPVQLTYTVKLTDPQTEKGTYGVYDKDGTNHKDSLYTNKSATLYPVDSNGKDGLPELFEKPTVEYTVKGNTPGPGPGKDDDDTPTTPSNPGKPGTPGTPPTDIPDTPVPLDPADPPAEDIPNPDVPKTGDISGLWLAMTALSGAGLAGVTLLNRKKRDGEV